MAGSHGVPVPQRQGPGEAGVPSPEPPEGTWPCSTLIWDFNRESINFCFLDAQFVVRFFSSPRKHTTPIPPTLTLTLAQREWGPSGFRQSCSDSGNVHREPGWPQSSSRSEETTCLLPQFCSRLSTAEGDTSLGTAPQPRGRASQGQWQQRQPSTWLTAPTLRTLEGHGHFRARARPACPRAVGSNMTPASLVQVPRHTPLNSFSAPGPKTQILPHTRGLVWPLRSPPHPTLCPGPTHTPHRDHRPSCQGLRKHSVREKLPQVTRRDTHNRTVTRLSRHCRDTLLCTK